MSSWLTNLKEHKTNIRNIVLIALALKVSYFLFAFAMHKSGKDVYRLNYEYKAVQSFQMDVFDIFKRTDASFYKRIAEKGYTKVPMNPIQGFETQAGKDQAEYAFFPMYPILLAGTMKVFRGNYHIAAHFLGIILSLLAFLLFYFFATDYFENSKKAYWASLVLMLFPWHHFFSMFYTEALFLSLLLGSFLSIRHKKWGWLIVCSGMLAITRTNGIVMGLPLLLYIFEQHTRREDWQQLLKKGRIKPFLPALLLLSMWTTFLACCFFYQYQTGDFFAFNSAQEIWARKKMLPWQTIGHELKSTSLWQEKFRTWCLLVFMLIAATRILKWRPSFQTMFWINILLVLISGSLLSINRFLIILFPFSLLFGEWILRTKQLKWLILLALFCAHLWVFYFWLVSNSIGF